MKVSGYMIEVELTDTELRVRGTNKMAHAALVQAEQLADRVVNKADDWKDTVVIPRADIAAVTNKPGGALTNGNLVVTTSSGRKVQLHYRRKSNSDFADLYAALA